MTQKEHDVRGFCFVDGVTNFTAEGFLDACLMLGDGPAYNSAGHLCVHPRVLCRMLSMNLLDFWPLDVVKDNAEFLSLRPIVGEIPTFMSRQVLIDSSLEMDGSYCMFRTEIFNGDGNQVNYLTREV